MKLGGGRGWEKIVKEGGSRAGPTLSHRGWAINIVAFPWQPQPPG